MKTFKTITLFIALCLSVTGAAAQEISRTGIFSRELGQQRELLIYTPRDYGENTLVRYSVMYVFDSDNREFFDFVHSSVSFLSDTERSYIVVGIAPTYIDSLGYGRNNDLLPVPVNVAEEDFFGGHGNYGNRDNFMRYVKNEVVPYINANYRTTGRSIAIGHSLSASFILSCFIEENGLFDDYIAVSPNLAYDGERLLKEFMAYDLASLGRERFLYVSSADEADYWRDWGPAMDTFRRFIAGSDLPPAMTLITKEFPEHSHWPVFAYSMMDALPAYFDFAWALENRYSGQTYPVTITLRVPDENDVVYITGNQPELGNWDPAAIEMEKISPLERRVRLNIHSPAQVKFTRGDWDTQCWLAGNDGYLNLFVYPDREGEHALEVYRWLDQDID